MKKRRIRHLGTVGVLTAACWTAWVPTATGAGVLRHARPTGVSTLAAGVFGRAEGGQNGDGERPIGLTDRRRHGGGGGGHGHGGPDAGGGNGRSGSRDGLRKSFDGIDLYDVGVASVGQDALPEKFALEPPDQGLCVGN